MDIDNNNNQLAKYRSWQELCNTIATNTSLVSILHEYNGNSRMAEQVAKFIVLRMKSSFHNIKDGQIYWCANSSTENGVMADIDSKIAKVTADTDGVKINWLSTSKYKNEDEIVNLIVNNYNTTKNSKPISAVMIVGADMLCKTGLNRNFNESMSDTELFQCITHKLLAKLGARNMYHRQPSLPFVIHYVQFINNSRNMTNNPTDIILSYEDTSINVIKHHANKGMPYKKGDETKFNVAWHPGTQSYVQVQHQSNNKWQVIHPPNVYQKKSSNFIFAEKEKEKEKSNENSNE